MQKLNIFVVCLTVLLIPVIASAQLVPVTVTYTADNIIGGWYQNGGAPIALGFGGHENNWKTADTQTIGLQLGHTYQLVWKLENLGPATTGNPGGFLAEISSPATIHGSSLLSSTNWQVAIQYGSLATPSDFNALTWMDATAYGHNGGSNIWNSVNGGPIAGISTGAQWIWGPDNFDEAGAPISGDAVFVKAMVQPVPEPSSVLLIGAGLLGLGLSGRRMKRKKA